MQVNGMADTKGTEDGDKFVDAVVVGAGFAGLYMLHWLKANGFTVKGFETGSDVGGTWYWNRYPGSRCDMHSLHYSYSFDEELEQEWNWTERYATQAEIQRYLSHVADRFNLRPFIAFNTSVKGSEWNEGKQLWRVHTDRDDIIEARFLILATGSLSAGKYSDILGLDNFQGELLFTSSWPKRDVQLEGKRVAIIGTGSSAVQAIPLIAQEAAHLTVFQRTPGYVAPSRNGPLEQDHVTWTKANYRELRKAMQESIGGYLVPSTGRAALATPEDERKAAFESNWHAGGLAILATFTDLHVNKDANETAAEFIRGKIREEVSHLQVAETLTPTDYPFGAKRMCVGTDYYSTFNRENVTLKDLRKAPIRRTVPNGVETTEGVTEVDVLVLAIGFDALTGSFTRIQISGAGSRSLAQHWSAGPRTYLGLMSHGFPNLFFVTGPGSPSVLSNMVVSIEQHVEWIGECLKGMRTDGLTRIEPTAVAEDEWGGKVHEIATYTLFLSADSWYLGANVPGKPRVFIPFAGGVPLYRKICDKVTADGYEGFVRSK